jgi:uncharacterized membrane protein YhaH (DUF805 family)
MNFAQAITSGFQNYVNFTGRAARSAYWFWVLFYFIVMVVAGVIDYSLFEVEVGTGPIGSLAGLALLLPSLAVAVRRLHDIDRSGWWVLLWLVIIIGWIILIIWHCTKGTAGPNRFGPDPLAGVQ